MNTRKALRWYLRGPMRSGARPTTMYQFVDDRSVKVVFSDGSFLRYACWQCALKSKLFELAEDAPTRVLVPTTF